MHMHKHMNFYLQRSWTSSGSFIQLLPLSCVYRGSDYIDELMLLTITPIVVAFLWFLIYVVCYQLIILWGHSKLTALCHSLKVKFFSGLLIFTYLILPGISTVITGAIPCKNIDPDNTMVTSSYRMV